MIGLFLNNVGLAITRDSYKETLTSVEDTHTTEAGTTIRNITRTGIYGLDVTMKGTEAEKARLDQLVQSDYVMVTVWDEVSTDLVTRRMYIVPSSYSSSLIIEDDNHRYYSLSFSLKDLE